MTDWLTQIQKTNNIPPIKNSRVLSPNSNQKSNDWLSNVTNKVSNPSPFNPVQQPAQPIFQQPAQTVAPPNIFQKTKTAVSSVIDNIFGPGKKLDKVLPNGFKVDLVTPTKVNPQQLITPSPTKGQSAQLTQFAKNRYSEIGQSEVRIKNAQEISNVTRTTLKPGYKEPGILGGIIESLKQSGLQAIGNLGATAEMVGQISGYFPLTEVGQKIQKESDKIIVKNPELNPPENQKWGVDKISRITAAAAPSLLAVIGAGMIAGPVGVIVTGFSLEGGSTYKEAIQAGTPEKKAQVYGVIVGSINSILERIFPDQLLSAPAKTAKKKIVKSLSTKVLDKIIDFNKKGLLEGGTEVLQQLVSNVVATNYDQNRKIWDGMLESYIGGHMAGGIAGQFKGKVSYPTNTQQENKKTEFIQPGEYTPTEIRGKIINTPLQNTEEGNAIIRASLVAEENGKNITITGPEDVKNEAKLGTEKLPEAPESKVEEGVVVDKAGDSKLTTIKQEINDIGLKLDELFQNKLSPENSNKIEELRNKQKELQETLKQKSESGELPKMDYDPTRLELNIHRPNTAGNLTDNWAFSARYKGFLADKKEGFDTKEEAVKFLKSYDFKGMTTNVAEDYAESKFFKETYFKNLKMKEKHAEQLLRNEIGEDFKIVEPIGSMWKSKDNILYIKPSKEKRGYADWLRQKTSVESVDEGGNNIWKVTLKKANLENYIKSITSLEENKQPKTQKEIVKEAIKEEPKTIKEIAKETEILEPNIRRILGVGEKEGTFERIDKGVYVLSKDGVDTAWIETGNSLESLPRLAKEGFKADMIFLDIPYNTAGVRGGNRGINFNTISPADFKNIVVPSVKTIAKDEDSAIVYMYSNSSTGKKDMMNYNQALMESGLIAVAKGTYTKTYKNGDPMKFGKYPMPPEGIIIYNKSGKNVEFPNTFNIKAIAPLYRNHYQTEKAALLLESIIKGTTKVGDLVLDPFSGSGVTLEQAIKAGRRAYGIEISEKAVEEHIKPKLKLALSKATTSNEVIEEINAAGISPGYGVWKKGGMEYVKPIVGKNELKTFLSNPEFKANPVLTVVSINPKDWKRNYETNSSGETWYGLNEPMKYLQFKTDKIEITLDPDSLNINRNSLKVGDKIEIDVEDILKKSPGVNQTRLYKDDKVYGFNPKNLEDLESPRATAEYNKIIKQSEIAKTLSEKLGVPMRRGKFRSGGALGVYKHGPKVVRLKSGGLQTVFHETAHFLDDEFKMSDNISPKERKELMVEYGHEYQGQPKRQKAEAFAEFIRFKLTGQEERLMTIAPEFYKEFTEKINSMPEVKEVLDTAQNSYRLWQEQPSVAKILSQLSIGSQNKGLLKDRVISSIHDLYTSALNDLHPLAEFSSLGAKKLGPIEKKVDPYILARNLRGWVGKADLFLNEGTFGKNFWKKDNKGKTVMNFKGKSYNEILKPIVDAGQLDEFRVFLVAQRIVNDLAPRNIPTGIKVKDAEVALKELTEKYPEFEKVAEERRKYKDELMQYAADNGIIGPNGLAKMKEMNKFHVPFYRVMEESQAGYLGKTKIAGNINSPIKRIKGSEREIIDPLESDVKDTYAIINAAERNNIGIAMANLADRDFELGRLFEKVVKPMKPIRLNTTEVMKKALEGTDLTVEDLPLEDMQEIVTMFKSTYATGPNMLNVNFGDKQAVYEVDPDLFKAIQGLNVEDIGSIMKILSLPAKALRAGATLTPDFSVRNPLRDQFSAFAYSEYGFIPGVDLIKGMFSLVSNDDVYKLFKAGGGEHSMMVSLDRANLQKTFKELFASNGYKLSGFIKNPLKMFQIVSELGEMGTRLGEMRKALKKNADPIEGAFASREVTLDFARIGARTKAINAINAFFNASLQGTDKMIRSFKNHPARTLTKSLLGITLPSILLYMANRDDERWKEIPAWQKNLFWIVLTDKHIYRIPKPFELGILFGSVPERILEYLDNNDPNIFKELKKAITDGFVPGFLPTAMLPFIENITNYSFFTDRPIVSQGQENLPPEAQAGTYTSEVAKLIGKAFNYSPSKVDNLIQGYTGGLGKYTVSIIDKILVGTGISTKITPPAKNVEDLPILKSFMIRNPVGSNSESVNTVYNMYSKTTAELNYVKSLIKSQEVDKAKEYIKKHPEIAQAGQLNGLVTTFSNINKVIREVRNSKTISANDKRDKINQLSELQTTLANKFLKEIQPQEKKRLLNFDINLVKKAYAAEKLVQVDVNGIGRYLKKDQNAFESVSSFFKNIFNINGPEVKINKKTIAVKDIDVNKAKEVFNLVKRQDPKWYKENIIDKGIDKAILLNLDDIKKEVVKPTPLLSPTTTPTPTQAQKEVKLSPTPTPTATPTPFPNAVKLIPAITDNFKDKIPYEDEVKEVWKDVDPNKVLNVMFGESSLRNSINANVKKVDKDGKVVLNKKGKPIIVPKPLPMPKNKEEWESLRSQYPSIDVGVMKINTAQAMTDYLISKGLTYYDLITNTKTNLQIAYDLYSGKIPKTAPGWGNWYAAKNLGYK